MSQAEATPLDASRVEGWTRRFTAFGARLNEAVDLYRGLGFEIRLEPAEPGAEQSPDSTACSQCFVMSLARTIYTRPRQR
jgi:hypothetical protein